MAYPGIKDPHLQKKIKKKFSKYELKSNNKSIKEICYPKQYTFQLPQLFLGDFINPKTPYRGALAFHEIGSGKTCLAITVSEHFVAKGWKVMFICPAALTDNFRDELRSPCGGNKYISKRDLALLGSLDPNDSRRLDIIAKSNAKIDENYQIYSYHKFANRVRDGKLNFKDTLVVIDEIHNMVNETGFFYSQLKKAISKSTSKTRLVLMTATPIFDKPAEVASLMNLLLPKDNQMPVGKDFNKKFIKLKHDKEGLPYYEAKNLNTFRDYMRGYISYYRGAPPQSYPRVKSVVVRCKMSPLQLKMYHKALAGDMKSVQGNFLDGKIPNNFLIGTRQVGVIGYRNGQIGVDGFKSMTKKDYRMSEIGKYSVKFEALYKILERCPGTAFTYLPFLNYSGANDVARFLDANGYQDFLKAGPGKKRYVIWSGETDKRDRRLMKDTFNHYDNRKGDLIKLMIGTPSIKEGVSFLRVREVYSIVPQWNPSIKNQFNGRTIRYCSHKDLPIKDQNVTIYYFLATHPTLEKSVDEHIARMSQVKGMITDQFTKAMKEASVDCLLNKKGNVYPGEPGYECAYS